MGAGVDDGVARAVIGVRVHPLTAGRTVAVSLESNRIDGGRFVIRTGVGSASTVDDFAKQIARQEQSTAPRTVFDLCLLHQPSMQGRVTGRAVVVSRVMEVNDALIADQIVCEVPMGSAILAEQRTLLDRRRERGTAIGTVHGDDFTGDRLFDRHKFLFESTTLVCIGPEKRPPPDLHRYRL